MFKRIILEEWQNYVPYLSFGVIFAIFLFAVVCTLLMKKERVDHLAKLPLESKENTTNQHPH